MAAAGDSKRRSRRHRPTPFATGPIPPDPTERGFKDTVKVNPGTFTTIRARYDLPTGVTAPQTYVYHCHILEHEDNDMMRPFTVAAVKALVDQFSAAQPRHHERKRLPNMPTPNRAGRVAWSGPDAGCTARCDGAWGRRGHDRQDRLNTYMRPPTTTRHLNATTAAEAEASPGLPPTERCRPCLGHDGSTRTILARGCQDRHNGWSSCCFEPRGGASSRSVSGLHDGPWRRFGAKIRA